MSFASKPVLKHSCADRVAVKMIVAQWYAIREPVQIGASVERLPFAVEALLAPWRVYS